MPASWTKPPRSSGCATRSPRSAATLRTSRCSASRPAAVRSARCSACRAARGLFNKAIPQSGASSWWATREAATSIAQQFIDALGVKAGDTDTLRALSTEAIIVGGATGLGAMSAGHAAAVPAGRRRQHASQAAARHGRGGKRGRRASADRYEPARGDALQLHGSGPRERRRRRESRDASARGTERTRRARRRTTEAGARTRPRSTCGRRSVRTRCSASRRSGSRKRSSRTDPSGCTSSRGRHRCSAAS